MSRRGTMLLAAAILSSAAAAGGAEETGHAALLSKAAARRRAAEEQLAAARKRHIEERTRLAAELNKAYAELDAAKAEAEQTAETLRRLRESDTGRNERQITYRIESLLNRVADTAGVELDPAAGVETLRAALTETLERELAALRDCRRVSLREETVVDRHGDTRTVPVLRLGAFAALACGDDDAMRGFLRETDGSPVVGGPLMGEAAAFALDAWARGGPAAIPVDIDGTLRGREPVGPTGIMSWLEAGGLFIIPIIAVGIVGIGLVLERTIYLLRAKTPPGLVGDTVAMIRAGRPDDARHALSSSRVPAAHVLLSAVDVAGRSHEQRETAMESALLTEAPRLERSLSLLGAMAAVAPLLGLLGTVSGMIRTFETISSAGTGNPRLLSGGISEALITTQFGLAVAIPLLLAHAWLSRWIERREALLERDAMTAFGVERTAGEEAS